MTGYPCKGRETGCSGRAPRKGGRCKVCRLAHNAREAARRAAKRAAGSCAFGRCEKPVALTKVVAAGSPVRRKGRRVRERAAYCAEHLEYYAERWRAGAG